MLGIRNVDKLESASDSATEQSQTKGLSPLVVCGLFFAVGLTCFAYAPVIFDFFAGDDFVHLSWLSQAVHHPELLWRNFHSSWLDGTTTKFYRPLISVFMYTDYLIGGPNGVAFHLTNLAFHLASTVFLFLSVRQIGMDGREAVSESDREPAARIDLRALFAATIFGLYPLHPEAVSWITGRVDSVVTAFCLGAIWFYLRWRAVGGAGLLVATLISTALGLLSKEMAITLPAVFLCREIFLSNSRDDSSTNKSIIARFFRRAWAWIVPTLPFWSLFCGYWVVRYFALGTLVGGYDNSLFFVANVKDFILSWVHALRMFVEPINRMLVGTREPITRVWEVCLALSGLSLVFALVKASALRSQILFVLAWLALSLLPVYKIFAISDDLQGSRLAYLATAPLAVLFAFACVSWQKNLISKRLGVALGGALCVLSFIVLGINNQPWVASGKEANAIRAGLSQLYGNEIKGDPQALFIGLPDQINGAYTCRNALDGMTKKPQLSRDITNCLMINPFEPIFPFGYLKDSIAQERENICVYRWSAADAKFVRVPIPDPSKTAVWSVSQVGRSITPADVNPAVITKNEDGSVDISSGRTPGAVDVQLDRKNCWSTNFVLADCEVLETASKSPRAGLELLYSNELAPGYELKRRVHADFNQRDAEGNLIFALRGLPEWSFGDTFEKVRLLLPPNTKIRLKSIACPPDGVLLPKLSFANSGYLGSKGYLHLGPSQKLQTVHVDCSGIKSAAKCELEITRANLLFEEQNARLESAVQWRKIPHQSPVGDIDLRYDQFPSPGIYEVRVRALGDDGKIVGVTSDHIVISVDTW